MIELSPELQTRFNGPDTFDRILALDGQTFRAFANRRTLRFENGDKGYFLKIHEGVGWLEILKNLLYFRLPVVGSRDEWLALRRLRELGVPTMKIAGFGERGWNPARRESFLITEELRNRVSLEDFCHPWLLNPPPPALKRALVARVAAVARTLHTHGVNHRDFYLCHFLLDPSTVTYPCLPERLRLEVIDLHRAQLRARTPRRWIVKDIAGLYFSAMDIGLTRRDLYRFMQVYRRAKLRDTLVQDRAFWSDVTRKSTRLYLRIFKRPPAAGWPHQGILER